MKAINNILFLAILFVSCNSQKGDPEKKEPAQPATNAASTANCYRYAAGSDTIVLNLTHTGASITGTLVYHLTEKDRNTGTIQGAMRGNVLLADYTFTSEGIESTRQVAFKLEGDSFVEGYGESVDDNGKMRFRNADSLVFNSSFKLSAVPCQ